MADRVVDKFGYSGKPMIFLSYSMLAVLISLYWFIFFPLVAYTIFYLFLRISIEDIFIENLWLLILTSFFFGSTTSFFIKRQTKKNNLPPWEAILGDQ
mgnify:CR=1 FL=1